METCINCQNASRGLWHQFDFKCSQCMARSLSRSGCFKKSRENGSLTSEYRDALATLNYRHEDVVAAYEADWKGEKCPT